METPAPVLKPDAIYIGDNGRSFCGEHAGATAKYTGRDLSGLEVFLVTPERALEYSRLSKGGRVTCETCGKAAPLIHTTKTA